MKTNILKHLFKIARKQQKIIKKIAGLRNQEMLDLEMAFYNAEIYPTPNFIEIKPQKDGNIYPIEEGFESIDAGPKVFINPKKKIFMIYNRSYKTLEELLDNYKILINEPEKKDEEKEEKYQLCERVISKSRDGKIYKEQYPRCLTSDKNELIKFLQDSLKSSHFQEEKYTLYIDNKPVNFSIKPGFYGRDAYYKVDDKLESTFYYSEIEDMINMMTKM